MGQMKASPNGQKLALVNGNVTPSLAEYFDFDNSTGIVSNGVSVQTDPNWSYYGVSFSPDNSKLYISCVMNGNGIYQFDLNAGGGSPAAVVASKTLIAGTYNYLGLQLATNGKIYTARAPFGYHPYLGVINDPNNPGFSCNYSDLAVNVGTHVSYGFPNFIDSYDYSNTLNPCASVGISEENPSLDISIFPNPFSRETVFKMNGYFKDLTLAVYNAYGQLVKQTENLSGETIIFQRDHLPEGIYFFRLSEGSKLIATDKLVIAD